MRIQNCLRYAALACLTVLGLAATEHHGQVKFGSLPLPGATVTALRGEKKLVAVTDGAGMYTFADLADGVWEIQVEMLCFTPVKREVAIGPDAPAGEWEMKMLPLDEIKASAPAPAPATAAAPTTSAAAGTSTAPAAGQPAPATSTPSIIAANAAASSKAAPKNGKNTKPNGKNTPAAAGSGFQRADVNASAGAAPPPVDAGGGSSMGADAGASSGASDSMVVNGSTSNGVERRAFGNNRRGPGSMFQKSIMMNESNSALNARPFSLAGSNSSQPSFNNATFGGSFGGPLWIPHILRSSGNFFINYGGTRNRTASENPALMPTDAERKGDFSQVPPVAGNPVVIYDPTTGAPFPNNIIPLSRISSAATTLLKLYPNPNVLNNSTYNYQIPVITRQDVDSMQARASRMINTKNFVNGTFSYQNVRGLNPNLFNFIDTSSTAGLRANEQWRHIFTKTITGTLTYEYSRYSATTEPYFGNRENVSAEAGIIGSQETPGNYGPPSLGFAGSGIASLSDSNLSLTRNQSNWAGYNVLWIRRPHNFQFGGEFHRQQYNTLAQSNPRGSMTFNGAATRSASYPTSGFDFADFLLGVPDASAIAYGNADKYFRQTLYSLYLDDDFRVTSSLSLRYGVRWDYQSPVNEKYGRLVNLDIPGGFGGASPVIGYSPNGSLTHQSYPDSLVRPDRHAISPRVGAAWRPFLGSSTLIRLGYSISYDTSVYQTIANQMSQQSPLSYSLNVGNTAANPLTITNPFHASAGTLTNTFAIDPDFRIGYAQNWQASVQQDIPWSMVMIVTYNGIKGTRAIQLFVPNTYPNGAVNPCPSCPTNFRYETSNGNSTREAGSVQLRRRFHNGFTATGTYTFSKSIDDAAGLGGRTFGGSTSTAQNWLNLDGERGLSSFDQRHLLNAQIQYTTGVGIHGGGLMSGWRGAAFKSWTFVTNITTGSGLPETPLYPNVVQGTGIVGPIRPWYTGASLYDAPGGKHVNPAAFSAPPTGYWGNVGRGFITGPNQFSLSASMARTFANNVDLSLNASNALNHVSYNSYYVSSILSNQFGAYNPPGGMRSVSLQMRWRF